MEPLVEKKSFVSESTSFGQRFAIAIKRAGFKSQRAFARHIEVPGGTVSRYVHGVRLPDGATMCRIARAMPDEIVWVMTGIEPEEPRRPSLPREQPSVDPRDELKRLIDRLPRWLIECLWSHHTAPD